MSSFCADELFLEYLSWYVMFYIGYRDILYAYVVFTDYENHTDVEFQKRTDQGTAGNQETSRFRGHTITRQPWRQTKVWLNNTIRVAATTKMNSRLRDLPWERLLNGMYTTVSIKGKDSDRQQSWWALDVGLITSVPLDVSLDFWRHSTVTHLQFSYHVSIVVRFVSWLIHPVCAIQIK